MLFEKSTCFILITFFFLFMTAAIHAQDQALSLTKEQALEDFNWLRFSLEYVHPRLYKYEEKAAVDARFDEFSKKITQRISGLDFLSMVSRINGAVHCGHLYTIPQGQLAKEVSAKKVLPFHIKVLQNKLYLFNDCSGLSLPNGSQILSINGKSDRAIFDAILPAIAADGYIQTRKLRLMERYFYPLFHGFDLYYHLHVDRSDAFKIEYLEYGTNQHKTITVKGISIDERQKIALKKYALDEQGWFKKPSPTFKIDQQNDYALLTISRSFYDKTIDPNFDSLLHAAFSKIKNEGIKNLVVDLRDNEGGDEHQQMELMSYLYNQPFKLYQNIYLSHLDFRPLKPIILERDTAKLLFNNDDAYMRRINDDLWINNYEYSDNLMLKPPKEHVFTGKLYVLMNGRCFSSAADLIADLKKTTNAVFIGEESGGTYEGPTGGDNIVIQLPHSKIMVRISPNIQIGYLYQQHPLGRGVLPTYPIEYSVKDMVEGKDLEREMARALIQGKK